MLVYQRVKHHHWITGDDMLNTWGDVWTILFIIFILTWWVRHENVDIWGDPRAPLPGNRNWIHDTFFTGSKLNLNKVSYLSCKWLDNWHGKSFLGCTRVPKMGLWLYRERAALQQSCGLSGLWTFCQICCREGASDWSLPAAAVRRCQTYHDVRGSQKSLLANTYI